MAETTDARWPRDWEAARDPLTGDYWAFSPTIIARDVKEVPVYVPLRPNGTPDLDGLLARLRLDPAEAEALRAEVERLRERFDALASHLDKVRALREENAALRRVAEAAEAALALLRDPRTRRIDAIAHLERYVADWRRILGG